MSTAIRSAADIDDVGWPEPAAVLARMLSTRNCWPSSRMKSRPWVVCTSLTELFAISSPRCSLSPLSRLGASGGGTLVGSIRPTPARTAAAAIPRLAGTSSAGGRARGAHPRLRLHQRGGDVAPVAFGHQVSYVELGQGGRALAAEGAPGGLILGRDEGQGPALDAHAGGPADAMGEPLRRVGEVRVDHPVALAHGETAAAH